MKEQKLTLRDNFAMSALPSIITYMDSKVSKLKEHQKEGFDIEEICCKQAYAIADKMIEARK